MKNDVVESLLKLEKDILNKIEKIQEKLQKEFTQDEEIIE